MTEPTLKSGLSQLFFTTIEMVSIPFYKIIAVVLSFLLLGSWKWEIVGIGTLFAMVYVGVTVRLFNKHLAWFDRLLHYRPGCRRYVYGLARYIRRQM